jgi:hypothetical protein
MTNPGANFPDELSKDNDTSGGIVGGLMLWVAVRCTLQYVILPFILPVVGVSGSASLWLSVAVSVFALGMMLFNLRRLWRTDWRWRYLALSLVAGSAIAVFLYFDLNELLRM